MLLWIIFAVLTAGALAALAWPFYRRRGLGAEEQEFSVYRDQLAELERDRERGLLAPADAEAARNEVARRLLKAEEARTLSPHPAPDQVRGHPLLLGGRGAGGEG